MTEVADGAGGSCVGCVGMSCGSGATLASNWTSGAGDAIGDGSCTGIAAAGDGPGACACCGAGIGWVSRRCAGGDAGALAAGS